MKNKKKLISVGLLASSILFLMVGCSSNENQQKSPNKEARTEQSSNSRKYTKNQLETIENYRKKFYYDQAELNYSIARDNANREKKSIHLSYSDIDKELRGLKIKIESYNDSTKRLKITVKNNYSEDIVGTKNKKTNSTYNSNTTIAINAYYKNRGKELNSGDIGFYEKANEYSSLFSFMPVEDIKSGETKTFEILLPYYAFPQQSNQINQENQQYKNQELDSQYEYYEPETNSSLVYREDADKGQQSNALENYDNFFDTPKLVFNTYPKEAFVSDEKIIKTYRLKF